MTDIPDWNYPDLATQAERTAARISVIRPLYLDKGLSAGTIALHYFRNATRNAVIGAVHRAHIKRLDGAAKPVRNNAAKVPKAKPLRTGRPALASKPDASMFRNDKASPDREDHVKESEFDLINSRRPPLPGTVPLTIMQLPNREGGVCRFPVVGGYCGVGLDDGERCCPGHRRFMYTAM